MTEPPRPKSREWLRRTQAVAPHSVFRRLAFRSNPDHCRRHDAVADSVWVRDVGCAPFMARKLELGTVWINRHIPLVNEMPHGGYKRSGYGKDMGIDWLVECTQIKQVRASHD